MKRHNTGQVYSTRNRIPFIILYSEYFDDYSDAKKKGIYFKSGSGREYLNRVLTKRTGTQAAKGGRLFKGSVLPKGMMEK